MAGVGSVDILGNNAGGVNDTGFPTLDRHLGSNTRRVRGTVPGTAPFPAPSRRSGFGVSTCWR